MNAVDRRSKADRRRERGLNGGMVQGHGGEPAQLRRGLRGKTGDAFPADEKAGVDVPCSSIAWAENSPGL